jgi:hypothetical protein
LRKVLLFSILLIAGILASQTFQSLQEPAPRDAVRLLTMACLAFIMIHVGYEFEIDRSNLRAYAVDYGVAAIP